MMELNSTELPSQHHLCVRSFAAPSCELQDEFLAAMHAARLLKF